MNDKQFSDTSPLFRSALELYSHSISHFVAFSEFDRKIMVLHLANAVELILKDIVLKNGGSIYRPKSKETISIWDCFRYLDDENIEIGNRSEIELLVEDRNNFQHKYGTIDEYTANYHINNAEKFLDKVVGEIYQKDMHELLAQCLDNEELTIFVMRNSLDGEELMHFKRLARSNSTEAFLSAFTYLEKIHLEFGERIGLTGGYWPAPGDMDNVFDQWSGTTNEFMVHSGITLPNDLSIAVRNVRSLKQKIMTGRYEPTSDETLSSITAIEKYEEFLEAVDVENCALYVERAKEAIREQQIEFSKIDFRPRKDR